MSIIAEFSIPASDFVLGKALKAAPTLTVEIEKVIPLESDVIPYFWVVGDDRADFEDVLEQEPELSTFTVMDSLDNRTLYRVEWDSSVDTFVQTLVSHDAVLQGADGDAESWTFQIRFPDSHALSAFHTDCRDANIDITVDRLYNPIDPTITDTRDLTDAQRSLIERAYDEGYFDVPRKITLAELAEKLGVSDQSVNERLRRGLSTLVESTLKSEPSHR